MNNPHAGEYFPGKLQAVAIIQTVIGSIEILLSILYGVLVLIMGVLTFGVGLLAIPLPFIWLTIGILSLVSGIKGLQKTPAYGLCLGVGIAQMCLLLLCDVIAFGCGLTAVIMLTQPEVKAYFGKA